MKKRISCIMTGVFLTVSLLTGITAGAKTSTKTVVKIYNAKVEIVSALSKLKTDYEKTHPNIELQIDTVGSDDYDTALKAKFASEDGPDIFFNRGNSNAVLWQSHLENLSDQKWVKDVVDIAKPAITVNGKFYGMPLNFEGYGFVYNKDIFAKVGIKSIPKTLTELKNVVTKLKKAKIVPFSMDYGEWYGPGVNEANNPMTKQADPDKFISQLNAGTAKFADNKLFKDWVQLIDLASKNCENPLNTDFNMQTTKIGAAKAAMGLGGNWIQPTIDKINPKLNVGIMPMPINDNAALNDKIFVSVPYYWVVNKDSKVKPQAKEFLEWLATSETGKKYITQEFKFIPALKSINATAKDIGPLGADILKYIKSDKVLGWQFTKYPDGVTQEFGNAVSKYVAGKSSATQLLQDFQSAWDKLKNQ